MGIIIKQSIRSTIYAYIGAVIGFVNVSLLMPKLLSTEEIGLINFILPIVLILSQFSSLGLGNLISRIFPYFRNEENHHNGFFTLGFFISLIGSLLSLVLFFSLKSYFVAGHQDTIEVENYIFYVLPLTIITLFLNYFDNFFRALFNVTIAMFLKEILMRLFITLSILFYFLEWINFDWFVLLYFLSYSLPTFILGFILLVKGEFVFQKPRLFIIRRLKKAMISISLFGMITGFGTIAIMNIDKLMIKSFVGLSGVGIYSITFYFAAMILLPARSIQKIAAIILSESWKSNDIENIRTIYYKTTITQLIIGFYIFLGLWINIDNIIAIIGPDFESGRYVIFFIGLANIVTMLSGVSSAIIATSKKYIYSSVFMLVMLVLIVITNLIFIPLYGIVGAALASFISMFITALLRFIYIWKSFKLQPYNFKHLIIVLIVVLTYFGAIVIPTLANPYLDVISKGIFITILFGAMIYFTKVSEDINDKANQVLAKLFK